MDDKLFFFLGGGGGFNLFFVKFLLITLTAVQNFGSSLCAALS